MLTSVPVFLATTMQRVMSHFIATHATVSQAGTVSIAKSLLILAPVKRMTATPVTQFALILAQALTVALVIMVGKETASCVRTLMNVGPIK